VLPASYGNNWIKAGDEINKSIGSGKYGLKNVKI
jgi:hypothetical protein